MFFYPYIKHDNFDVHNDEPKLNLNAVYPYIKHDDLIMMFTVTSQNSIRMFLPLH